MNKSLTKNKFFIAKNGQDFCHIDLNDLFVEVKAGNIFKDSFVFDEEGDRWVHLISHPLIPSLIKNEALFCCEKVEVPDFKPKDEIIVKEIGSVDNKIVNILEAKLAQFDSKISDFQRPLSVESDLSALSDKIVELEKSIKNDIAKTGSNKIVEQVSKNIIDLKDEVKTQSPSIDLSELKDLIEDVSNKIEETRPIELEQTQNNVDEIITPIKDSVNKVLESHQELKESIVDKEDDHTSATLTRIENFIKNLDDKIDNQDESSKVHQEKFDKLYVKYKNQVMENKVLKSKLDKAVKKMNILHDRVNEMAVDSAEKEAPKPSLEELVDAPVGEAAKIIEMARPEVGKVDEDFNEILGLDDLKNGKSFEVINTAKWMIDNGEGVLGPYRYDQMIKLKSTGKINPNTLIKIQGKGRWKGINDFLELTAQSKVINEDKENPESSIYLVERSEYRAELHELVTFNIGDEEHKGYLTNLSLGGGFIELTRLDEESIKVGQHVTLYLSTPTFSDSIVCDLQIRRLNKKRPKGFGFTFEGNSEKNLEVLGQFIIDHISGTKKPGSSAA